jgi:response regulator RpfG family c-di-GMP phosphodiesterase
MPANVSKARILIVDDDPLICTLLIEGLSREGFECRAAGGGEEALRILGLERFDALISDLRMPGVSGLALLEAARSGYPQLSFLIATGVDDVRVAVEAMKHGAADYLVKPFRLEAVVAAVERALEKKRLELEVETYRERLEEMVEQRTKQLQAAIKHIQQTYDDTLQALGAALDLRDMETEGHSRRVTLYCLEIARALDCTTGQLYQIVRGSYLHDIGKIGIPDAILLKPDKLTAEEVAVMQTHARIGYELVCRIPFLAPAAEVVLTHQEAYDGTGYPQGLMGEEIPLGARIFAVADTLDAMTSDRPYRSALPMAVAREEIRRESGRQFDPRVVEAFFAIAEEVWENIRLEVARNHTSVHPMLLEEIEETDPGLQPAPPPRGVELGPANKTPGGAARVGAIMKSAKGLTARVMASRMLRCLYLSLLLSCLLCAMPTHGGQLPPQKSGLPLLTRVEQIRNLTLDEANLGYPVRVRAVVTYFNPAESDLFIQDSTAGIWVAIGDAKPLVQPGQFVEVEGVSTAPDFAPQISEPHIRVLGQARLPVAQRVTFDRMASTKEDSQWVEVEGVVHTATKRGEALILDVAVDGGRVKVEIADFREPLPTFLVDAKVRIHGVCGAIFNRKNQLTGVILYSPSLNQLHIVEQALIDPFVVPRRPIASLLRFTPQGASGHRVRVRGVVTLQQPGSSLFIKEEDEGLYVHTSQTTPVRAGDLVEVVGFPAVGEYAAVLQEAVFRRMRAGPSPIPTPVTAAEALEGGHDADIVRIQARLLDGTLGPGPHTLNMQAGTIFFLAQLEDARPRKNLEALVPGSLLQLTGICMVEADEDHNPRTFRLLVRSLDEVVLLQPPPWWTIKHMVRIIATMAALVLASTLWAVVLKRQVAEKTKSIREWLTREAAAKERYQELFENANDMVFTCDLEGHFSSLNKAGVLSKVL